MLEHNGAAAFHGPLGQIGIQRLPNGIVRINVKVHVNALVVSGIQQTGNFREFMPVNFVAKF